MADPRIAEPILHVDMDAFFVEVERLDDPELRGRPAVVGGGGRRGVVASASYEARAFGVRSAMPMSEARRRCPGLAVAPARHRRYGEVSEQVFAVFQSFTPLVEGLSLDEAFLDISGLRRRYPDSRTAAEDIRSRIRAELDLPASVGAASTLYLAKLASGRAKPDGVYIVKAGAELPFLHGLDVRDLWGVGSATQRRLGEMGVETAADLARIPAPLLQQRLGKAAGAHLHRLANGVDERAVTPRRAAKSISAEQTYGEDLAGEEVLRAEMLRRAEQVAWRLRRAGAAARTISIKVRFSDFETVTRSETLAAPTDAARDIYQACCRLLDRAGAAGRPVRLLGASAGGLAPKGGQRRLAVDGARWDDAADAVDAVRAKFGRRAVGPARLASARDGRRPAGERPISDG